VGRLRGGAKRPCAHRSPFPAQQYYDCAWKGIVSHVGCSRVSSRIHEKAPHSLASRRIPSTECVPRYSHRQIHSLIWIVRIVGVGRKVLSSWVPLVAKREYLVIVRRIRHALGFNENENRRFVVVYAIAPRGPVLLCAKGQAVKCQWRMGSSGDICPLPIARRTPGGRV
jgi:hypothetical protein